jgi:hypothetical protein
MGFAVGDDVRRGLRWHRRVRLAAAALWSAFLGAALSIIALFLMPEDWTLPPPTPGGAAWTFFALWLLALVPAAFAVVLAAPRRER